MMTQLPIVFLALIGLLGLAIGSFLNVVIYRVPRGESIVQPGSHCPRCDTAIRARHNVPVVGWLMLRGKCFDCSLPISTRYPIVEAANGAGMTIAAYAVGASPLLPLAVIAVPVLITLTMMAVDQRRAASISDAERAAPALPAPHMRSTPWHR